MQRFLHHNEDLQRLFRGSDTFHSRTISIPNLETDSGLGPILIQCIANEIALNTSEVSSDMELRQHTDKLRMRIRADIIEAISANGDGISGDGATRFKLSEHRKRTYERLILHSLQYNTLYEREQSVKDAHTKTFQWVFSEKISTQHAYHNLQDWLQSSEQVYWITGKPGSGKTTLVKFIVSTIQNEIKAGNDLGTSCSKPCIIAYFYFWALGADIQASKEGLYRTLIYQLLSQRPAKIPQICPKIWETMYLFGEPPRRFEENELRDLLASTLENLTLKEKVCIFVDGLDEFAGDCDDLVAYFKQLVDAYPIKLCVASRPWEVFRDALQHNPRLQMEDLTHNDIQNYVTCRLQDNPNFDKFVTSDPVLGQSIIESIVEKAQGVFLWVELVVSSLIVGLRSGDRIPDLQRRLDRLPRDLEGLFDRIVRDLDSEYMEQAIQYLRLMDACPGVPSAVLFSFADENPEFAIGMQLNQFDREPIDERVEVLRKRLNTRLKGLLEIGKRRTQARDSLGDLLARAKYHAQVPGHNFYNPSITTRTREYAQYLLRTNPHHAESVYEDSESTHSDSDAQLTDEDYGFFSDNLQQSRGQDPVFDHASCHCVQYLHRTVKDYFNKPRLKEMLTDIRLPPFDPHLKLCSGYLAFFKSCHTIGVVDQRQNHSAIVPERNKCKPIFKCLESASLVSECNENSMVQILEELERSIGSSFTMDHPFKVEAKWIRPLRLSRHEMNQQMVIWATYFEKYENSFLALTVKAGVVGYVKRKVLDHGYPRISQVISSSRLRMLPVRTMSLRQLLKATHDQPSYIDILLKDCVVSSKPNFEMVQVLLRRGANPNTIFRDLNSTQATASEYTPWVALLALIMGVLSRRSWDPIHKLEWIRVAQSMVSCGAHVNKRAVHDAVGLLRFWKFTVSLATSETANHGRHDDVEMERNLLVALKGVIHHGDTSQPVVGNWEVQYPVVFESLAGGKSTR